MGNFVSYGRDFHYEYTEEPHASRRNLMLKKYPELKKLMKINGDRIYVLYGIILVLLKLTLASWKEILIPCLPISVLDDCLLGAFLSSAIFMQMHEAGHGLIFGPNHVWKNKLYAIFLNFGAGYPLAFGFNHFHKIHHKNLGVKDVDAEYPSEFEAKHFNGPLGKYIWLMLNPILQHYRMMPKGAAKDIVRFWTNWNLEAVLNIVPVVIFDLWLMFSGRFYILRALFFSTFIALSFNFIGYWNISTHVEYMRGIDTYNYNGWLNRFMCNFGYHNEHHDFPSVPSRFLPKIPKIAPEFYEDCFTFDEGVYCNIIKFVFEPKYGVSTRLKRIRNVN